MLLKVVWCEQGGPAGEDRLGRERQDLEASAVEGDEVFFDEAGAQLQVLVEGDFERGADSVVGVEADAVAVGGKHKEEVERAFLVAEGGEESFVQEAVG